MKVAICTTNQSIMLNMVSMVAKNGCKFTKIKDYSVDAIKGHDICIFDLDNLTQSLPSIKKDYVDMQEIVLVGISRSDEILDMFRPVMNVEKKPFLVDNFVSYKQSVVENSSELIVNKDAQRIFDQNGIKISELLDESLLNDEERLLMLKDKIKDSNFKIQNEDDFFEKIDIAQASTPEPSLLQINPITVNKNNIFEDGALLMYRTKKLKSLNLSTTQIEEKLKELTERNLTEQSKNNQPGVHTSELLSKLKSGYFSSKSSSQVTQARKNEESLIDTNIETTDTKSVIAEPEQTNIKSPDIKPDYIKPIDTKPIDTNKSIKSEVQSNQDTKSITPPTTIKSEKTLDVVLSPEKEAYLSAKLEKIRRLKQVQLSEIQKTVQQTVELKQENNNESTKVVIEDSNKELDKTDKKSPEIVNKNNGNIPSKYLIEEDINQNMEDAIQKMATGKNIKKNNNENNQIEVNKEKNLPKGLPTHSLFDLVKDKIATSGPKEDLEANRKKTIERKIKPPSR